MSLFQGAGSIHINNSAQDRLDEQEELEDEKRRREEVNVMYGLYLEIKLLSVQLFYCNINRTIKNFKVFLLLSILCNTQSGLILVHYNWLT